ncbi:MAG: hypothetical protein JST70_01720 [Bacteroidetes bacterium]|nr:hypothetical protein [Bacteroidota bacterium]
MLFRIIFWSIILTLLFRFIFRFLLPVVTITRAAQSKMAQMQKQMEDMQRAQQTPQPASQQRTNKIDGDYIDFEEVK